MADEAVDVIDADQRADAADPPPFTRPQFLEWRSPRRGTTNPELLTNPVWAWLVETKLDAYHANDLLQGPADPSAGPCWSFNRCGCSKTELPDGRLVHVAGEHEDAYDANFHIYNDVIVTHPDGRIDIRAYPVDAFPPTDFHSATLVSDRLILIGSLGYPDARHPGTTQVLSLDLSTFAISSLPTTGEPPGWIHRHTATLAPGGDSILVEHGQLIRPGAASLVENIDQWQLRLSDCRWERLTDRRWPRRELRRTDRRPNQLWQFESTLSSRNLGWDSAAPQLQALREALGGEPDLDRFQHLFTPSVPHQPVPAPDDDADDFGVTRLLIDGITVRFVNDGHRIQITAEGPLPDALVDSLAEELRDRLTALEHTPWSLTTL